MEILSLLSLERILTGAQAARLPEREGAKTQV
jgi:hypothetical protein